MKINIFPCSLDARGRLLAFIIFVVVSHFFDACRRLFVILMAFWILGMGDAALRRLALPVEKTMPSTEKVS